MRSVPTPFLQMLPPLLAVAGGCHSQKPSATAGAIPADQIGAFRMTAPQQNWSEQPLPAPAQPELPVASGPLPLVYLSAAAGNLRVVDADSKLELVSGIAVTGNSVIAVSENGITVAGENVHRGPLPDDHRYAVFISSERVNLIRNGTVTGGRPDSSPAGLLPPPQPSSPTVKQGYQR